MGAAGPVIEIACSVAILFCIDGETEVTVKGKEHSYKKPVSEVEKGEFVLTYNGNNLIYSKVKENKREEGQRTFFTFKIKDKNSGFKLLQSLIIIQFWYSIKKRILSLNLKKLQE